MAPDDWIERCIYLFNEPVSNEEIRKERIIQWSFRTYNNSFTVNVTSYNSMSTISEGKTSDHGEGDREIDLGFRNTDIVGGYIEIDIHIKEEEIIINSYELIIVFSVISVAILFRKKILENYRI